MVLTGIRRRTDTSLQMLLANKAAIPVPLNFWAVNGTLMIENSMLAGYVSDHGLEKHGTRRPIS
jgi:hypothetical protein